MLSLQNLTTHKSQKWSVKIMVSETKNRIGYASKRTTCHSTAPRCPADGKFRLKLVDFQAGGISFRDGINENVCASVCLSWARLFSWHKTDRRRNSAENTYRCKIYFQHSVFIWKILGNFFYHLTTLSRNKESKWKRTVRLGTLIYRYYFLSFLAY
jgi:hypothetical protein